MGDNSRHFRMKQTTFCMLRATPSILKNILDVCRIYDLKYMEKETANEDMTEVEFTASLEDFANTGRAGRRNAMPNVLDPVNAAVETGSLPFELDKLKCSDPEEGKSDSACAAPSSSQGGAPSNPPGS